MLSRKALMQALWRQRAYADRTGTPFVFIRVMLSRSARAVWNDRVAQLACKLCRSSDVAGWHGDDGNDVGVLLPAATPQGALRVVRELEAGLRARADGPSTSVPEIACELFVYPGTNFSAVMDWAVGDLTHTGRG